jgi:hypothetical protein
MSETTRDTATEAAISMLDGQVCECGHLECDHYFRRSLGSDRVYKPCDASCACTVFRPVRFRVERVS